jgi:hypothetical protein
MAGEPGLGGYAWFLVRGGRRKGDVSVRQVARSECAVSAICVGEEPWGLGSIEQLMGCGDEQHPSAQIHRSRA